MYAIEPSDIKSKLYLEGRGTTATALSSAVSDAPFLDLSDLVLCFVSGGFDFVLSGQEGGSGIWQASPLVPERAVRGVELDVLVLSHSVPWVLLSLFLQNDGRIILQDVVGKPAAADDGESNSSEKRGERRVGGDEPSRH